MEHFNIQLMVNKKYVISKSMLKLDNFLHFA